MFGIVFLVISSIATLDGFQPFYGKTKYEYLTEELERIAADSAVSPGTVETMWIDQKLDHFDNSETATFRTKYVIDRSFFGTDGPIILYIGGEGPISDKIHPFLLYSVAQEKRGLILLAEHRYYGESLPQLDLSRPESYKYLSSRQALADVANLITHIKTWTGTTNSKVIVAGGSYPGNLAAWMRLLYPNLVYAAVSTSAPVLAVKDFTQYLEKVGQDFHKYGTSGCYDKIVQHFNRMLQLLQTPQGIEQLKQEEGICEQSDLTNHDNQELLFYYLFSPYELSSQYGPISAIQMVCHKLGQELFVGMSNYNNTKAGCVPIDFSAYIQALKIPSEDKSWFYQQCTEFGYFTSTDSNNQPFSRTVTLDFLTKMCYYVFGVSDQQIDRAIENTNHMYGGKSPQVSNVLFVNGDADPWGTLGITSPLSNDEVYVIPGGFHCSDFFCKTNYDTTEVRKAKEYILTTVRESWLK